MGWLISYDKLAPGVTAIEQLKREALQWSGVDGPKPEVVAASQVGSVCYFAVRFHRGCDYYVADMDGSYVAALVFLTTNREGFGYKDMDETMGPCEATAPASFIAKLSPLKPEACGPGGRAEYAFNWRQRCLENAAAKGTASKAAKAFKVGDKIELAKPLRFTDGAELSRFQVYSYTRRGKQRRAYKSLDNGGLYRITQAAMLGAKALT